MAPTRHRFVIRHDGRYLYYLTASDLGPARSGRLESLSLFADDEPMILLSSQNYTGGWFSADHRAHRILVEDPPKHITTGYTLDDPDMASVKYPLTLTVEQRDALGSDENKWLYKATYREEPATRVELATDTGDWLEIDGTPPPTPDTDAPEWVPDLLPGLMNRREYHHVMPGRIVGLRDVLYKQLQRKLGLFNCTNNPKDKPSGLYVTLHVPFERSVTHWQPDLSRRTGNPLQSGKNVQSTVRRVLRLPVPYDVPGANYAEALAAWNEAIEYWLGVVRVAGAGSAKACNHCAGHGFVGGDVFTEYDVPTEVWDA